MMSTPTSQGSSVSPISQTVQALTQHFQGTTGLVLLGCAAAIVLVQWMGDGKKAGRIASGYWGGTRERASARKKAQTQIKSPRRNQAALYIGTPPAMRSQWQQIWQSQGIAEKTPKKSGWMGSSNKTLYLPDVQRGVAISGAPGSGKTFSAIDPVIRSALDQGFPVVLYDFKYPAQTSRAAAYAIKRGYNLRVFAPGFPESETCNPLDFLSDSEDAVVAGQFAQVVSRNFDRSGGQASSDKFFEEAGDSLVEGILLVTKAVGELTGKPEYCDLMTAQALLSLSNLPARLELASQSKLKVWTSRPLSQVISVKDSEKTVAGIVGTAQRMFQRFLKRDFIGAFCGETSLPLDLEGKQLIVFGLDRNNRDIVGPLLAAMLHLIVSRNVARTTPRIDPLVVALDELPTLYLPNIVNWLNENREDGFVGLLGFQNLAQLQKSYGRELSRAIIGATGTKFIFNPQDGESAKFFADYLGEEEIEITSKSRSRSKGGNSRSWNQNFQKRYLFEPAQFLKLQTGEAIVISPASQGRGEAYIPWREKIKVPAADIAEMSWAESKWQWLAQRLATNACAVSASDRRSQFEERRALVEELFPLPEPKSDEEIKVEF
ncbi:MAG: type IV secretory system conjugative DNA transfer family protein [Chroococcales cyanobacterium]